MNEKILIADDEARMRKLVRDFLKKDGYAVFEAADGEEALDVFYAEKGIALVILDVMMPKMNGYEVLEEIRQSSEVPVLMLTAKSAEEDELSAFSGGADEYITKPFSPKILVARVNALLRRQGSQKDKRLCAGGIAVDEEKHEVTVDGEFVRLSVKEFELLVYFMRNKGMALTREKILSAVWEFDYLGEARTIDTHVKMLRSKLGKYGKYIRTIWGMGYKFEVDAEETA
ncbi:MAG: response regulator transcription factor [Lachnospiraceae bacterium]|nr:response regulator transcription factor [Lachnospiraceae bacterium]